MDGDDDDDKEKAPSTAPQVRDNNGVNFAELSIKPTGTRAGLVGSDSSVVRVSACSTGVGTAMVKLSTSTARPFAGTAGFGVMRVGVNAKGSNIGIVGAQMSMARTSTVGTNSGAAGSSAGVPQLINQF